VRNGKAETRPGPARCIVSDGMSCEETAKVLYLNDDTIGYWYEFRLLS
jgi:hypothetical protein